MKSFESDTPTYPRVLITKKAMQAVGGELVPDLDQIHGLVREGEGLSKPIEPRLIFFKRWRGTRVGGFHPIFTKTVFIKIPNSWKVPRSIEESPHEEVRKTICHEVRHLVDSHEHPIRTMAEYLLRMAYGAGAFGFGYVYSIGLEPGEPKKLVAGAVATVAIRYYGGPAERRGEAAENDSNLRGRYGALVSMPKLTLNLDNPVGAGGQVYDWADPAEGGLYDWVEHGE